MQPTDILLNDSQITGTADASGFLLSVRPGVEYVNGKPTDNVICIRYYCVFPQRAFEKITIKVPGDKPVITNEQIQKSGNVQVKFKNLTGRFYRTPNDTYALSCSADAIEVMA